MTILPEDSAARKETPVYSGVLKYFPDAIAAIAHVSFKGNQKHNPGEPLHWSRDKSNDHLDCVARHLMEAGTIDAEGNRHSALLAWRAMANLQIEMEKAKDAIKRPQSRHAQHQGSLRFSLRFPEGWLRP